MEEYLPQCLNSLVIDNKELFQKLDVIVVNDGSPDRTSEIAHEFNLKYPSVFRVIDKGNGHYGSCVNVGIRAATGKYVKILDADDSFDTRILEGFVHFLGTHDLDVCFTDAVSVTASGTETERMTCGYPRDIPFGLREIAECSQDISMHRVAYRLELLREMGYRQLEGVSYTDTQWCFLPMASINNAFYLPIQLYRYLSDRDGQSTSTREWVKNQWMQQAVLADLIRQYHTVAGTVSQEGDCYLKRQLEFRAKHLYDRFVFDVPLLSARRYFVSLEEELKETLPELYERVGEWKLSRRFGFRYLRYARRSGVFCPSIFLLLRAYSFLCHIRIENPCKR